MSFLPYLQDLTYPTYSWCLNGIVPVFWFRFSYWFFSCLSLPVLLWLFFFWNPSYIESSCLIYVPLLLLLFALHLASFFSSSSFNVFIFYFLWLVFLCSIQVRIAPTVTTWSNKTPTALPSHPPAASPSDTQVYHSLFLFEQDSAHLNICSFIFYISTQLP